MRRIRQTVLALHRNLIDRRLCTAREEARNCALKRIELGEEIARLEALRKRLADQERVA